MIAQCKPMAIVGRGRRTIIPQFAGPISPAILQKLSEKDRQLLEKLTTEPAEYVDNPVFRKPNLLESLFDDPEPSAELPARQYHGSLAAALEEDVNFSPEIAPPLGAEGEVRYFQRFNYARYRVFRLIKLHRGKKLGRKGARELLTWAHRALQARAQIVQSNVALVLAMAKRVRLNGVDFTEMISEGNLALLRSVDKFDCSRGFKFSTYACRAILKSFSRTAQQTSRYRARFPTGFDPTMQKSDFLDQKRASVESDCIDDLRQILQRNLANLSDIEQQVICARFALSPNDDPFGERPAPMTLEQVGALIGRTKERVRQIQNLGLMKLRQAMHDSNSRFGPLDGPTWSPMASSESDDGDDSGSVFDGVRPDRFARESALYATV